MPLGGDQLQQCIQMDFLGQQSNRETVDYFKMGSYRPRNGENLRISEVEWLN